MIAFPAAPFRLRPLGEMAACMMCIFLCACGGSGGSRPPTAKLVVVVQDAGVQLGASEQLHAQLVGATGSPQDVTDAVNWSSLAPTVVQVTSSGVITPVATGKATIQATLQSASVTANADITATKLFGVTECCPNNFVVLAPSVGNSLPPLSVGDITIGFNAASATDPVNHRFYVFPVSPNNSFSMVQIDTTTATIVSTQTLSVNLFTAQWDQKSGNIFAITGCCPNQLVSINPATGNASVIASVGDVTSSFNGASSLDQVNHTFYFIRFDSTNAASLVGIDTSTGSVSVNFVLSGPIPFLMAWNGANGKLVGVAGTPNPPANPFVSIEPTTAAETILAGDLGISDILGWTMVSAMDSARNRFYAIRADLGNGGPATSGTLNVPKGVAVDSVGNLFIADTNNGRIRKVDTSGVITTVVGTGNGGFGGDGGPATSATLGEPTAVTVDNSGNLFIADTVNNRIRKVDTSGVITTVAGMGTGGFSGDGGPATSASLSGPTAVSLDGAGNLFIADTVNNRIRKVDTSGVITTVAGTVITDFGGDGGPATSANLSGPTGVAVDSAGKLYIADALNNRIRKVDAGGVISTVAGIGSGGGFSGDGGPATSASLSGPTAVSLDGAGNLFIADTVNNRIRKVDTSGVITTVAGIGASGFNGDGGPATSASLSGPTGVAVASGGEFYIADAINNRIRKVDASGVITTIAGTGKGGFGGDGGPATGASLNSPTAVTVDHPGNIFIADTLNNRIRKVDTNGVITTVAGTGNGGFGGDGGPAGAASLSLPRGVVVDSVGNLLIADTANNRIRKVDTSGVITTVAGMGTGGFSGDGGPATSASLSGPTAVSLDGAGNLFIADTANNRIRKVNTSGVITTFVGTGNGTFSGDGGPATTANLNSPTSVAVGGAGIFYITDYSSNRIRKVDTSGVITTAAGTGGGNLNQLVGIDTATGAISEKLRLRTGVILLGAE